MNKTKTFTSSGAQCIGDIMLQFMDGFKDVEFTVREGKLIALAFFTGAQSAAVLCAQNRQNDPNALARECIDFMKFAGLPVMIKDWPMNDEKRN